MSFRPPDPVASSHYASLSYALSFRPLSGWEGKAAFSMAPVNLQFTFDTGRVQVTPGVDLYDVEFSYSWFDQDVAEGRLLPAIVGICAGLAGLLETDLDTVLEAVTIQRVWTVRGNQEGSAAVYQLNVAAGGGVVQVVEELLLSRVGDSDTAQGTDAGEGVAQ